MKILVTGGCGFIGSHLVRLLIEQKNCEVINLDKLTYAGNPESLADLADHPKYHFEHCDLGVPINEHVTPPSNLPTSQPSDAAQKSLTEIFEQHQPDAVMHLAAESHVDRSIDAPDEFVQTNIVGTYHLLQASLAYWRSLPEAGECEGIKVGKCEGEQASNLPTFAPSHLPTKETFRFLHVSTDEVYGSLAPDAPAFSETTPYEPHSPYAASKAAADHLVRAWHATYGLPVLVTNSSNNYGPGQFPEKLIPVVIEKCLRGEPIPVYGKGENIRDWLYVEDHAEALYTVLTKGRVGETYNIGGGNERNNLSLVKKICEIISEFRDQRPEDRRQRPEDREAGPENRGQDSVDKRSADIAWSSRWLGTVRQSELGSHKSIDLHEDLKQDPPSHLPTFSPSNPIRYESLITFVTDRPGHDMRYAIDTAKIRDELGWQPKVDFESGLRKTVRWYVGGGGDV